MKKKKGQCPAVHLETAQSHDDDTRAVVQNCACSPHGSSLVWATKVGERQARLTEDSAGDDA